MPEDAAVASLAGFYWQTAAQLTCASCLGASCLASFMQGRRWLGERMVMTQAWLGSIAVEQHSSPALHALELHPWQP